MGGKVSVKILSSFLLVGFPGGRPDFPEYPFMKKSQSLASTRKIFFTKVRPTNQPTNRQLFSITKNYNVYM